MGKYSFNNSEIGIIECESFNEPNNQNGVNVYVNNQHACKMLGEELPCNYDVNFEQRVEQRVRETYGILVSFVDWFKTYVLQKIG